ncbi:MAG: pirin family protein [Oleiphilaceae bacterium]|nr:pirin family protein [Oleiphilaceae bacterium]
MATELRGHKKDLDGFSVTRILPHAKTTMVGPFIFLDHMGPADFDAGEGIDVRPHPHIGLSTITYLFEGSLLHRDSLGNNVEILPGDVNWMTAGRGIVHSERETIEVKAQQHRLDGLQSWLALPREMAEIAPSFTHIKRCKLPHSMHDGVVIRLIAGEAYGLTSPLKTYSPMFYVDVLAKQGKAVERPNPQQECLLYVISGAIHLSGERVSAGQIRLLEQEASFTADENARVVMLGGEAWPDVPHIYWNFVSFDKQRIEQAKDDWRQRRFPDIPGDAEEFTPLPQK